MTSIARVGSAAQSLTPSLPQLREGDQGPEVTSLQRKLNALGATLETDGKFGPLTRTALLKFQRSHGVGQTGVLGEWTRRALDAALKTAPAAEAKTNGSSNAVVSTAQRQVGVKENGPDRNPYSTYFGRPPEMWCADFASWVFEKAGKPVGKKGVGFASAAAMAQWFQKQNRFSSTPRAGSAVFFNTSRAGKYNHVGVVEKVENGRVYTIEGNSSNAVSRRSYPVGDARIVGYGSV